MSLSQKFETSHRQLKACLEEHGAMVDARLAAIEARMGMPDGEQAAAELARVLEERDALAVKNAEIVAERDEAAQDASNYKELADQQSRVITSLMRDLEVARSTTRYHGAYNMSGRKSQLRDVAEVVLVLGGAGHLGETIEGFTPSTVAHWRSINAIPKRHKPVFEDLLHQRGFSADHRMFR